MKKFFGFLLAILMVYAIYVDLTVGTLPSTTPSQQVDVKAESITQAPAVDLPFFEAKVMPGDTVISIVEQKLDHALPVSISELIEDFQTLNKNQTPDKIQIGSTYLFPDYTK